MKDKYTIGEKITVSVDVSNTGKLNGEEVVQLYIRHKSASVPVPINALKGFQRIALKKGETKKVQFTLNAQDFSLISNAGKEIVEAGEYEIIVGGGQPGKASVKKTILLQGAPVTIQ